MKRWSKKEWHHCLYCFYVCDTFEKASDAFQEQYPSRSSNEILHKFHKENIDLDTHIGSGSKKKKRVRANKEEKKKSNLEKELGVVWEKQKQNLLKKHEEKKLKKIKQKAQKMDLLTAMVSDAVSKIEKSEINVKCRISLNDRSPTKNCVLWFEFSDLQLGTLIREDEMRGLNNYNWDVWRVELEVWKNQAIRLIEENCKLYKIDKVVFSLLGDFVEGNSIFEGQAWSVDRHVVDQAIVGSEDVANAFIEVLSTFPDLKFHILEVFGNHGRLGRKGETPYSNSLDKVFLRFLKLRLESSVSNLVYHENDAWFYLVEVYGWNHLLLHGDQGMSSLWSKRPTINGLEKGIARYNHMLQQQIHFVHCGHFHQDWQLSFNQSQMLINGSFVGTSAFSARHMVSGSAPVQTMHVFEPNYGLVSTARMHLHTDNLRHRVKPKTLKN